MQPGLASSGSRPRLSTPPTANHGGERTGSSEKSQSTFPLSTQLAPATERPSRVRHGTPRETQASMGLSLRPRSQWPIRSGRLDSGYVAEALLQEAELMKATPNAVSFHPSDESRKAPAHPAPRRRRTGDLLGRAARSARCVCWAAALIQGLE